MLLPDNYALDTRAGHGCDVEALVSNPSAAGREESVVADSGRDAGDRGRRCPSALIGRLNSWHGSSPEAWALSSKSATAPTRAWICFRDQAGASLTGAVVRTWAPAGQTSTLTVVKGRQPKLSMAPLACYRPGEPPRLTYRIRTGRCRDLIPLLDQAHQTLHAPMILIWENLAGHHSRRMQRAVADRDRLTLHYPAAYVPDLNPVEQGLVAPQAHRPGHPRRPHPGGADSCRSNRSPSHPPPPHSADHLTRLLRPHRHRHPPPTATSPGGRHTGLDDDQAVDHVLYVVHGQGARTGRPAPSMAVTR
ncbi:transposase [Streptomyces sp. ADMS]|uniref:transposase n=1 Tax=Streptomyces sp. ADMS TaxID=3071415 RepID=UPI003992BBF6